jgi:hypothetical protein
MTNNFKIRVRAERHDHGSNYMSGDFHRLLEKAINAGARNTRHLLVSNDLERRLKPRRFE